MTVSFTRFRIPGSRRAAVLAVMVSLAVALLAIGTTSAAERVHFKNGHTITAMKVSIEGDMVFLTMQDGSRVGFPKELVKDLEQNAKPARLRSANRSGHGGRGPSLTDLNGYQRQLGKADKNMRLAGSTRNRDPNHKGPYTYGFSYQGSGYNGGERRRPSGSSNGINVFDHLYEQRYGLNQNQPQQTRISPQAQAKMSGGDEAPKNRLMPTISPEGTPKSDGPKRLESSNPNVPPSKR
jgi:hypothetical protein